jgi:hypothetical protein
MDVFFIIKARFYTIQHPFPIRGQSAVDNAQQFFAQIF